MISASRSLALGVVLNALAWSTLAAAGMSDLIVSSQAMEETTDRPSGVSKASGSDFAAKIRSEKKFFSISLMAMYMGPSFANLDGHLNGGGSLPSSSASTNAPLRGGKKGHRSSALTSTADTGAPSSGTSAAAGGGGGNPAPGQGYTLGSSMRYSLAANFRLSEQYTLGPVVDVAQKFYGSISGDLKVNDPQLRLSISDVIRTHLGANTFGTSTWLSLTAPVSDISKATHTITSLNLSLIPRLQFSGSNFSLSGIISDKVTLVHKDGGDRIMAPIRLFGGIQGNYRISRMFTSYLMAYSTTPVGPEIPMADSDIAADSARTAAGKRKLSLSPGMFIRATDSISISPRMNWTTSTPIGTTTFGMNANIHLI